MVGPPLSKLIIPTNPPLLLKSDIILVSKHVCASSQHDRLQLKNLQSSEVSHVVTDQSGAALFALHASSKSSWIIDSGAIDHITGMSHLFSMFSLVSLGKFKLANGSFTDIAGKGTIHVSSTLDLSFVLHVPHLSRKLLSVSALTKSLDYSVNFYHG